MKSLDDGENRCIVAVNIMSNPELSGELVTIGNTRALSEHIRTLAPAFLTIFPSNFRLATDSNVNRLEQPAVKDRQNARENFMQEVGDSRER